MVIKKTFCAIFIHAPYHFMAALCTKSLQLLIQFNLFIKVSSFYLFNAILFIDSVFFLFIQL